MALLTIMTSQELNQLNKKIIKLKNVLDFQIILQISL